MNRSLLRTILLTTSAGLLVLLPAFGWLQWHELATNAAASATGQADAVSDVVAVDSDVDLIRRAVASTALGSRGELAVHLAGGRTIGFSHAADGDVRTALGGLTAVTVPAGGGSAVLRPVPSADGQTAVVETYSSTSDFFAAFARWLVPSAGVWFATITVMVLVAYRLIRPLTRSVQAITAAMEGMDEGRTGIEIPGSEVPEVAGLMRALNDVSRRIERLIASERELAADLSHRLRTPVTALRLDSESLGDSPVAERVRNAVLTLEKDVTELIRTAGRAPSSEVTRCDAGAVLHARAAFWSMLATHQSRRFEVRIEAKVAPVELSEKDIGAVVDALLGNVFQHTPPGTPLAATIVRHAGWVTLVVEDGGPGIPDTGAALRRGTSSRGSTGLGLAIARDAVEATGGTIQIDRGRLGGARVRLRFAQAQTLNPP